MARMDDFEFEQLRSMGNEAAFFAEMGRFFASPTVRRECGGYALSDGPRYRWFVARFKHHRRVLGFISVEQLPDKVHIRNAYLRTEARGRGLFRELRRQVLDYVDGQGLACITRTHQGSSDFWRQQGFELSGTRGQWVTMVRRKVHA